MMYWIVFALFTAAETFSDVLLSWYVLDCICLIHCCRNLLRCLTVLVGTGLYLPYSMMQKPSLMSYCLGRY